MELSLFGLPYLHRYRALDSDAMVSVRKHSNALCIICEFMVHFTGEDIPDNPRWLRGPENQPRVGITL